FLECNAKVLDHLRVPHRQRCICDFVTEIVYKSLNGNRAPLSHHSFVTECEEDREQSPRHNRQEWEIYPVFPSQCTISTALLIFQFPHPLIETPHSATRTE